MSALLSQRKGYKRADMPLYRMKRVLYCFYAYRDGAALYRLNQAQEEREAEERAEYEAIQHAKKASNSKKLDTVGKAINGSTAKTVSNIVQETTNVKKKKNKN